MPGYTLSLPSGRVGPPGTSGVVDDRGAWEIAPDEAVRVENGVMPEGVLVERGGWEYTGAADPLGGVDPLTSAVVFKPDPASGVVALVVSDQALRLGRADGAGVIAEAGLVANRVARGVYRGEVLLCDPAGRRPVLRYSGSSGPLAAATGTVSAQGGGYIIRGQGTNFTTALAVNGYIEIRQFRFFAGLLRIVNIVSNTTCVVATPVPWSVVAQVWIGQHVGKIGLCTLVDDRAALTINGGVVSGDGTQWATGARIVRAGDYVAVQDVTPKEQVLVVTADAVNDVLLSTSAPGITPSFSALDENAQLSISGGAPASGSIQSTFNAKANGAIAYNATASQVQAALEANPDIYVGDVVATGGGPLPGTPVSIVFTGQFTMMDVPDWTITSHNLSAGTPAIAIGTGRAAYRYVIGRPLVGRDIAVHDQRLFVTGVEWDPRALYYSPAAYDLGSIENGNDSLGTNAGEAMLADRVYIPHREAPGRILALLDTRDPGPLLALAEEAAYPVFGSAPDFDIQVIEGAGCVHTQARGSGQYGDCWGGPEDVYRYSGGRAESLTEGRRNRAWQALMQGRSPTAIVDVKMVERHLVVAYCDGPRSETWVLDLIQGAWLTFTGITPRFMHVERVLGSSDELYWIPDGERRVALMGSCFRDQAHQGVNGRAPLLVETGRNLVGSALADSRVLEAKVAYEMVGPGSLRVSSGSVGPLGLDEDLAGGPVAEDGQLRVRRLRPKADPAAPAAGGIGGRSRQFGMRFERVGAAPDHLRLHGLDVVVRQRRSRS